VAEPYSGPVSFRTSLVLDFTRSVWSGFFLPGSLVRRITQKCHMNVNWRTECAGTGNYSGAVSFRTSLVLDFARSVWSGHFFLRGWKGSSRALSGLLPVGVNGGLNPRGHGVPTVRDTLRIRVLDEFATSGEYGLFVCAFCYRRPYGGHPVPTRIMQTDNRAGNSPTDGRSDRLITTPTSGSAPLPPTLP